MKNFSEVTVIDTAQKLAVLVEIVEHDNPTYQFTVNDQLANTILYLDLLEPLTFKCHVENGAVEVKITINGHEVMPIYQHLANPATSWVTADWMFQIPQPFYIWYHTITGQGWFA